MKHALILALALCALPAAAEVMATAKNAAGGQIVMSTDACPVAKLGGDVRMYDPVIFEIDKSTEAYRRFESKQRKGACGSSTAASA